MPSQVGSAPQRPSADQPQLIVLEATARLGGKVSTERVGGLHVEAGPDAFLIRTPAAVGPLTFGPLE